MKVSRTVAYKIAYDTVRDLIKRYPRDQFRVTLRIEGGCYRARVKTTQGLLVVKRSFPFK
jgi:hypothetical protein